MRKNRCDCCGKFRKESDLIGNSSEDEWWLECSKCCSQIDYNRFFKNKACTNSKNLISSSKILTNKGNKMDEKIEVIKSKENVLIKTAKGEYHFSKEDYRKLGKKKAIKMAQEEIEKKLSSQVTSDTIDFEMARNKLGFCEYGIKDFCEKLNLDIKKSYKLSDLNKKLTMEVLKEYPSECLKMFGKNCIKYLGTVEELIDEDNINLFLREEFISPRKLHQLSVKFAYSCLDSFEAEYPEDKRPRVAIETKQEWIDEKVRLNEL